MNAAELAQAHWNKTPLHFSEEERYQDLPWLPGAAEFAQHAGERVLESAVPETAAAWRAGIQARHRHSVHRHITLSL